MAFVLRATSLTESFVPLALHEASASHGSFFGFGELPVLCAWGEHLLREHHSGLKKPKTLVPVFVLSQLISQPGPSVYLHQFVLGKTLRLNTGLFTYPEEGSKVGHGY